MGLYVRGVLVYFLIHQMSAWKGVECIFHDVNIVPPANYHFHFFDLFYPSLVIWNVIGKIDAHRIVT